jgi:biopolymer transport protein ExbB/TolQ
MFLDLKIKTPFRLQHAVRWCDWNKALFILEILIGVTPLLGLLGAVSGLVKVFGAFR